MTIISRCVHCFGLFLTSFLLTGCAATQSISNDGKDLMLKNDEGFLIFRALGLPSKSVVHLVLGTIESGKFVFHFTNDPIKAMPDNGFFIAKVQGTRGNEAYIVSGISIPTVENPTHMIRGHYAVGYRPCGDDDKLAFKIKAGQMNYLGDFELSGWSYNRNMSEPSLANLAYSENINLAKKYIESNYASLNLTPAQAEVIPVRLVGRPCPKRN